MTKEEWIERKEKQMRLATDRKIKAEAQIAKLKFELHNHEKSYTKYLKQRKRNQGKTVNNTVVIPSTPQKTPEQTFDEFGDPTN